MFEKSKSSITFKEFENKLNIITEIESDWGHFYDTDYETDYDIHKNLNPVFRHKLHKPKKRIYKKYFIDIESQELKREVKEKQPIKEKQTNDYNYEKENKIVDVIKKVLVCVQMTCITIAMGYVILKII